MKVAGSILDNCFRREDLNHLHDVSQYLSPAAPDGAEAGLSTSIPSPGIDLP